MSDKEDFTNAGRAELEKGKLPPVRDADIVAGGTFATPEKLTVEEQMALYEKDLKENDWGHQPC